MNVSDPHMRALFDVQSSIRDAIEKQTNPAVVKLLGEAAHKTASAIAAACRGVTLTEACEVPL